MLMWSLVHHGIMAHFHIWFPCPVGVSPGQTLGRVKCYISVRGMSFKVRIISYVQIPGLFHLLAIGKPLIPGFSC